MNKVSNQALMFSLFPKNGDYIVRGVMEFEFMIKKGRETSLTFGSLIKKKLIEMREGTGTGENNPQQWRRLTDEEIFKLKIIL